jgi:hypothetical protein
MMAQENELLLNSREVYMGGTMTGWGGILLDAAVTLVAAEIGMPWWKLAIVFLAVTIGSVMVRIGE